MALCRIVRGCLLTSRNRLQSRQHSDVKRLPPAVDHSSRFLVHVERFSKLDHVRCFELESNPNESLREEAEQARFRQRRGLYDTSTSCEMPIACYCSTIRAKCPHGGRHVQFAMCTTVTHIRANNTRTCRPPNSRSNMDRSPNRVFEIFSSLTHPLKVLTGDRQE